MMQASGLGGGGGSAAMIQQMRERLFNRADKNQDGGLSLEEFKSIRRPPPGSAGPADSTATQASGTAPPTGIPAGDAVATAFRTLDADGDGKLTSAELEKGRRQNGGQGMLSADALEALLAAQEGVGGQRSQGQAQAQGGGLQAVVARMLQAYGGTQAAA